MFKNILVYSLIVSATCTSSLVLADPWRGDRDEGDRGWQQQQRPMDYGHDQHGPRYDYRDRGNDDRRYYNDRPNYNNRPYAYHQRWQRGGYVPQAYWGPDYRVNNWRGRGLPPPPQGHRWLNVNGQYILIAAATGIITSILMHQ